MPVRDIFYEKDRTVVAERVAALKCLDTAVGTVDPKGGTLTFNPKQLKGDKDTAAPQDLRITDLQLKTDDGHAWLIKDGEQK